MPDAPLSKSDIAARFKVSLKTITRWCDEGKLPFIKIGNAKSSRVYFDWEDVAAHLKKHFGQLN